MLCSRFHWGSVWLPRACHTMGSLRGHKSRMPYKNSAFWVRKAFYYLTKNCAERSDLGDVKKLDRVFTMLLNEALDVWQKQNLSFSALLKSPEDTFQQRQSEFIRFLEWYLPTGRQVEKWYRSLPQDQEEIEVTEMYDEIRKII